tara:strand:+ start:186 stop:377 length:192 start_codon:yes stop_codon:yes gene_type:complete
MSLLGEAVLVFRLPTYIGVMMDKHDREIKIKVLMKLKLQRKVLDKMSNNEISSLFSILKRYAT